MTLPISDFLSDHHESIKESPTKSSNNHRDGMDTTPPPPPGHQVYQQSTDIPPNPLIINHNNNNYNLGTEYTSSTTAVYNPYKPVCARNIYTVT